MKLVKAILMFSIFLTVPGFCEDTSNSEMAKASEALTKKDYKSYLNHMKRAVELGPDKLSRPYYQFGLARAYAYNKQVDEAIGMLETIYKEGIEAPMAFLSTEDPAFKEMINNPRFVEFQKKRETHSITISPVAGNVFQVEGAGCFLAASIGNDGILLVDSGYPQIAARVSSALKEKSGTKPVRRIINTHEHVDHVGGNSFMRKDAVVIAHTDVRPALQKPSEYFSDFSVPAMPEKEWPDLTFRDELSLYFNGEEIQVIGLPAHSEGDSIVYFKGSGVLHMGDNYFPETSTYLYPGKNIQNYFEIFGPFLKSLPDTVVVMSGHDKPVPVAKLRSIYDETNSLFSFAKEQVKQKKTLEEAKSDGEKNGYPARWIEFYFTNLTDNKESHEKE